MVMSARVDMLVDIVWLPYNASGITSIRNTCVHAIKKRYDSTQTLNINTVWRSQDGLEK